MFRIELRFFVYDDQEVVGIQSHTIACATQDEVTAIGHQIMAGPELYEAAKSALSTLSELIDEQGDTLRKALDEQVLRRLERAVTKAEGRL